ncbi:MULTISPECIES: hypothetical protein [Streptacidiphilus]|uniref:ESX-1 secretion-associated protein n=2 Tax=Streptacidiphilus TaxID=228398 RepID=A0ABV6ULP5_9ACTN|nr:hypothetical protein [Streptacidiphilus jeojiense]
MPAAEDGYAVPDGTLEQEAGVWDSDADQLQSIASKAGGLRLDRVTAGIFQMIVTAHDDLVSTVSARANEGSSEMHRIAQALRTTDRGYREQEASTAQSFKALQR